MKDWVTGAFVVLACPTMLFSLHADWQATGDAINKYGMGVEGNPIIRLIGSDAYFGSLIVGVASTCRENAAWRRAAVGLWIIQSLALNTHVRYGTYRPALLFFEVRF